MAQQLKRWQGWLLFGGSMVVVFVLGLIVSSLLERRAEVVSIYNNRKHIFKDAIVAQNELFAEDFPVNIRRGSRPPTPPTKVNSIARSVSTCSLPAPRWSCYGLATPSLWSTTRLVDTSTLSKTWTRSFVLAPLA